MPVLPRSSANPQIPSLQRACLSLSLSLLSLLYAACCRFRNTPCVILMRRDLTLVYPHIERKPTWHVRLRSGVCAVSQNTITETKEKKRNQKETSSVQLGTSSHQRRSICESGLFLKIALSLSLSLWARSERNRSRRRTVRSLVRSLSLSVSPSPERAGSALCCEERFVRRLGIT